MANIKDVAKLAGVSSGTVSNVLNGRNNVSVDKLNRVKAAIAELGYEVNESAKTLRMSSSRTIALIVPDLRSRHYVEVYESLCKNFLAHKYTVEVYSTENIFSREEAHIKHMISSNVVAIVSFPTYVNFSSLYGRIPEKIHLAIVGPMPHGLTRPYLNVSFDYAKMASDIADYIKDKQYKNVALFIDSVRFSGDFKSGICSNLSKHGVRVTNLDSTRRTAVIRGYEILGYGTSFDAVVTSNILRAKAVRQAYNSVSEEKMPEIITLSASDSIFEGEYTTVFLNYKRLGDLVSDSLLNSIRSQSSIERSYVLDSEGMGRNALKLPYLNSERILSILAVDDFCTTALSKIIPQFEKTTGVKVNITFFQGKAIPEIVSMKQLAKYDILIADLDYIRTIGKETSLFLRKEDARELWTQLHMAANPENTYFPEIFDTEICYSFNTHCQMLFYRDDWMHDSLASREYYQHSSIELCVPRSYSDIINIARFFQTYHITSQQKYGFSMSSFNSNDFISEFLCFLRAENLSIFTSKGKLNICNPEVFAQIQHYFKLLRSSNVKDNKIACNGIDDFIRGNSIMSVFSTANTYLLNRNEYRQVADFVSCSDVPGKRPIVGSNVIGILKNSTQLEEAAVFLEWVFHDTTSKTLTLLSGQPIIKTSTQNNEIRDLYPWLKHYNRNLSMGMLLSDVNPAGTYNPRLFQGLVSCLSNAYLNPDILERYIESFDEIWNN